MPIKFVCDHELKLEVGQTSGIIKYKKIIYDDIVITIYDDEKVLEIVTQLVKVHEDIEDVEQPMCCIEIITQRGTYCLNYSYKDCSIMCKEFDNLMKFLEPNMINRTSQ